MTENRPMYESRDMLKDKIVELELTLKNISIIAKTGQDKIRACIDIVDKIVIDIKNKEW